MIPIDRTEIEAWGRRHEAKGEFPFLISKLIFETTPKSTFFEIPSGSAVFLSGWDGIVQCKEETTFVPQHKSLWEFKTNGVEKEAESDYRKRTENSLGIDKSKTTFIFVTTASWPNKDVWISKKKAQKEWADVRVYNSSILQNWLNITDVTAKWFIGTILGRSYETCLTIEDFWEEWSIGPKGIILVPELVLSGREASSQQLINFLQGEPNLMAVRASTKDEAIAFIIATVLKEGGQLKEQFYSKSLILETLKDFRVIKKNISQLNLITKFEDTATLHSAVGRKHHVLLPLGPDDPYNSKDIIEPPKLERDGQIQALIDTGLSREDAIKFSKEAGRDQTILKKLLGFQLNKIKWKYQDKIHELIPVLLIGRWDETKEGDLKVIEKLSGISYDTFSEKLYKWLEVESPPIIKIGNTWRLTSPLDSWTNLSNLISAKEFKNLRICFLETMQEINPAFELEPRERSFASIIGKTSLYSTWCREGLTQSLILVGLYGDKLKFQESYYAQEWVDDIIKELLYNAPGYLWASRNSELPLIAEASPKSFFESAYHSLSLENRPIMQMFVEDDGLISTTSNHTGLLRALEGLAWTEEYVYDATLLLAKLCTLDPGGKLLNRPSNSLREIFKPWHYQTLASFDDRMKILSQIIKKEYETGWKLLSGMIPNGPGTASPTYKLRWRLFEKSFDNQYQMSEIISTHSYVLDLLLEHFDYSEKKLIELLEKSESKQILAKDRDKVLTFIESILDKIEVSNNTVWHELRITLSEHRSLPDAKWALPESILTRYEEIYKKLEPKDPVEQIVWMFNSHFPYFPEGLKKNELSYSEQERLIVERRVEGLKTIYKEYGFQKVKELIKCVKETPTYGDTLARIIDEENEVLELCEYFKENEINALHFIQRFVLRKSIIKSTDWVFDLYEKLKERGYTDVHLARVFHELAQSQVVWDFLEITSKETQINYWKGIYPHFWGMAKDQLIYGIDKLLEVNRYISALEVACHATEKLPTQKLIELLEKVGTRKSEEEKRIDSYVVTKVIEELETRGDIKRETLMRLEWLYLPFLASYRSSHKPKVLHEELSINPEFFIEVLKWIYKSDIEELDDIKVQEDISDEAKQGRGRNSYDLLQSWKEIPGVTEKGKIDESLLWDWINKVRELAEQSGRLTVADIHIGFLLAEFPENEEPWPPIEICRVIDKINTDSLKSGFSSGAFNKRGSSTRGPFDGGDIERGHAEYFYKQAVSIKYDFPETAKLLTNLAEGYELDAKRMDERLERDKLDY